MHPYQHAQSNPDRPAFVVAESGVVLTYGELDAGSNRAAQLYRSLGLLAGDVIALLLRNGPAYAIACATAPPRRWSPPRTWATRPCTSPRGVTS